MHKLSVQPKVNFGICLQSYTHYSDQDVKYFQKVPSHLFPVSTPVSLRSNCYSDFCHHQFCLFLDIIHKNDVLLILLT